MNVLIKEFIEEVRDEIMCYEELGQEYADKWEKGFHIWVEKHNGNNKALKEIRGRLYFVIADESEIFEVADSYYDAVMEKDETKYWKTF